MIDVTVMTSDGYEQVKIPTDFLPKLASEIKEFGMTALITNKDRAIIVKGFLVTGSMTGKRMIMLGTEDGHETVQG